MNSIKKNDGYKKIFIFLLCVEIVHGKEESLESFFVFPDVNQEILLEDLGKIPEQYDNEADFLERGLDDLEFIREMDVQGKANLYFIKRRERFIKAYNNNTFSSPMLRMILGQAVCRMFVWYLMRDHCPVLQREWNHLYYIDRVTCNDMLPVLVIPFRHQYIKGKGFLLGSDHEYVMLVLQSFGKIYIGHKKYVTIPTNYVLIYDVENKKYLDFITIHRFPKKNILFKGSKNNAMMLGKDCISS